jgi:ABC-2 type transport system permease protein
MFGWVAVQPALAAMDTLPQVGVQGTAATVLSLIPTSWPLLAVDAAASGAWGAAFGWLGAFAALTLATVLVTVRLLAPSVTSRGVRRRSRPLGSRVFDGGRSFLPDTPLGAVVGKELRQWWRDPWRGLEVRATLWAGLFIGLLTWSSDYFAFFAPFSGVICAFIMALATANMYGHDGTAVWQTVVGQGPGTARADVRGRQIAILLLSAPGALALSVLFIVFTGEHWTWPYVLTGLAAVFGVGSGLSLLFSVVALSPGVDPQLRVDANDTGDNQLQVWFSLVAFPVLSAPTLAAAVWLGLQGMPWLALPIALANGALVTWFLGRVAYRRLETRLPEMFTRIRYGKAIAAQAVPGSGGSLLDQLERSALATNAETRPTGS